MNEHPDDTEGDGKKNKKSDEWYEHVFDMFYKPCIKSLVAYFNYGYL